MQKKTYIAIDLKSFYASVECVERGKDPMTTCQMCIRDRPISHEPSVIIWYIKNLLKSCEIHLGFMKYIKLFVLKQAHSRCHFLAAVHMVRISHVIYFHQI